MEEFEFRYVLKQIEQEKEALSKKLEDTENLLYKTQEQLNEVNQENRNLKRIMGIN